MGTWRSTGISSGFASVAGANAGLPAYEAFNGILKSHHDPDNNPVFHQTADIWLRKGTTPQCLEGAEEWQSEDKPRATIMRLSHLNPSLRMVPTKQFSKCDKQSWL